MGLIFWGLALIIIGLLLGATGGFGLGGLLANIGWLLLIVGVVLAVIYAIGRAGSRATH